MIQWCFIKSTIYLVGNFLCGKSGFFYFIACILLLWIRILFLNRNKKAENEGGNQPEDEKSEGFNKAYI